MGTKMRIVCNRASREEPEQVLVGAKMNPLYLRILRMTVPCAQVKAVAARVQTTNRISEKKS